MNKELFIFNSHNMLISGVTDCGKTHFILDLLETVYKNHFDNIILFCPTFEFNTTYNRDIVNKNKKFIILDPEVVKKKIDNCIRLAIYIYKGTNTLFIIDDCANLHDTKIRESELCYLAFSGRHYGITTWVLNQKYNSIVKDFRENIRFLVLFYNKDRKSMKSALEENNIIPNELHDEYMEKLKNNKRSKLLIRLQHPFKSEFVK